MNAVQMGRTKEAGGTRSYSSGGINSVRGSKLRWSDRRKADIARFRETIDFEAGAEETFLMRPISKRGEEH